VVIFRSLHDVHYVHQYIWPMPCCQQQGTSLSGQDYRRGDSSSRLTAAADSGSGQ
jgi:hypothetical protein